MKKTEYAGAHVPGVEERQMTLDAGKHDDYGLPEFAKEVPVSSKKHDNKDTLSVEYEWKKSDSPIVRVHRIFFRKGEALSGFYRVAARDGADSICFVHNNTTYILRKTVREIAHALYNAHGKIKGAIETIAGYLRTVLGNDYVIARVEGESWAFDKRIAKGNVNYVDMDGLEKKNKRRLCEMITERIAGLHSNNLIIGRFTLNNILLGENDMQFTDLRRLRVSRRKSFVIDEFKSILQYLYALGVASKEDIYCSIAYYAAQNEESCQEWYTGKKGKKASDQLEVVTTIEDEIYG
jgi:hypothetical protein